MKEVKSHASYCPSPAARCLPETHRSGSQTEIERNWEKLVANTHSVEVLKQFVLTPTGQPEPNLVHSFYTSV